MGKKVFLNSACLSVCVTKGASKAADETATVGFISNTRSIREPHCYLGVTARRRPGRQSTETPKEHWCCRRGWRSEVALAGSGLPRERMGSDPLLESVSALWWCELAGSHPMGRRVWHPGGRKNMKLALLASGLLFLCLQNDKVKHRGGQSKMIIYSRQTIHSFNSNTSKTSFRLEMCVICTRVQFAVYRVGFLCALPEPKEKKL